MQYHATPCNTMQYNAIPCNTMQYHACLLTADGAYHCPVGSIWLFLAKVDVQDINSVFCLCIIRKIAVRSWLHFGISDLQQQQGSLCGSVNLPLGLRTHQIQALSGFSTKKNSPPNLCRQSFSNSRFQKQANAGSLFQRK